MGANYNDSGVRTKKSTAAFNSAKENKKESAYRDEFAKNLQGFADRKKAIDEHFKKYPEVKALIDENSGYGGFDPDKVDEHIEWITKNAKESNINSIDDIKKARRILNGDDE